MGREPAEHTPNAAEREILLLVRASGPHGRVIELLVGVERERALARLIAARLVVEAAPGWPAPRLALTPAGEAALRGAVEGACA